MNQRDLHERSVVNVKAHLLLIHLLEKEEKINVKMRATCTERTRDTSNKDGFPRVQRLRSIHHKIAIVQVPRADLDLSHTKTNRFQL